MFKHVTPDGDVVHVIAWPFYDSAIVINSCGILKERTFEDIGLQVSNRLYCLPDRFPYSGETRKEAAKYLKKLRKSKRHYEVYVSGETSAFIKLKDAFNFVRSLVKNNISFEFYKRSDGYFGNRYHLINFYDNKISVDGHPDVSKKTLKRFAKELDRISEGLK